MSLNKQPRFEQSRIRRCKLQITELPESENIKERCIILLLYFDVIGRYRHRVSSFISITLILTVVFSICSFKYLQVSLIIIFFYFVNENVIKNITTRHKLNNS